MTEAKQQHYLPQFYSKLFVDAFGFLHVVRCSAIDRVRVISDFDTLECPLKEYREPGQC